jgi:hypothetical protein
MKARPILMSGPMVRALLEGRKTQTRRIVKPQPAIDGGWEGPPEWALFWMENADGLSPEELARLCPYGQPGDLLWVREAIVQSYPSTMGQSGEYTSHWGMGAKYTADGAAPGCDSVGNHFRSRPSIHMPRWASRLTLELTEVRVERLQHISEADAIAEGIEPVFTGSGERCGWMNYEHKGDGVGYCMNPVDSYASLWRHINGPDSWQANPWVWCIAFRIIQRNNGVVHADTGLP